jgi:hypothetical protein
MRLRISPPQYALNFKLDIECMEFKGRPLEVVDIRLI